MGEFLNGYVSLPEGTFIILLDFSHFPLAQQPTKKRAMSTSTKPPPPSGHDDSMISWDQTGLQYDTPFKRGVMKITPPHFC